MSTDPFVFSEEDKVITLLARSFYLSSCKYKQQKPSQNMLESGPSVTQQYARLAVNALGFDEVVAVGDLIALNDRLYKEAFDSYNNSTITTIGA